MMQENHANVYHLVLTTIHQRERERDRIVMSTASFSLLKSQSIVMVASMNGESVGPSSSIGLPHVVSDEEVISGRFFLRQLCLSDPFFAMLAEDYLDRVLGDHSPQQAIANWNIISVVLADHGLSMNDEVLFRLMSGDPELAAGLTEDIHSLKPSHPTTPQASSTRGGIGAGSRWRVLIPTGQKEMPLKMRLNPFVMQKENSKPPTTIHIHDAERMNKMRTLIVTQLKELEVRLQRAKEKKSQETRAAEAAAQQKAIEEQVNCINLQKSDMLKLLEELETRFIADEKKIHHIKRLTGIEEPAPAPATITAAAAGEKVGVVLSPRKSPTRIRDTTKEPFARQKDAKKGGAPRR